MFIKKKPYSNSLSRPPKLILLFLKIYLFTPQNTSELYSGLGFNWSFNIRLNSPNSEQRGHGGDYTEYVH